MPRQCRHEWVPEVGGEGKPSISPPPVFFLEKTKFNKENIPSTQHYAMKTYGGVDV
jgi:hypothetical protein